MKKLWKPVAIAASVGVVCTVLLLAGHSFLSFLDNKVFDLLALSVKPHAPTGQVTIVDIDELSLAELGSWPWPRSVVANVIERLDHSGAALIALDLVLPDGTTPPDNDDLLAAALSKRHAVLGYDFAFDSAHTRMTNCADPPKPLAGFSFLSGQLSRFGLPEASAVICDTPLLASQMPDAGFINTVRDHDGIVRRIPLLALYRGAAYPSFALATKIAKTNADTRSLLRAAQDRVQVQLNGRELSFGSGAELLLRYRRRGQTFPHYSAAQVLKGGVSPDVFQGKIVVVGRSASGLEDSLQVSLDERFQGVEVQANAIDNLMAGDYFYHPTWALRAEVISIFITALVTAFLLFRLSAQAGVGSAALLALAVWFVCQMLMASRSLFISPVPALVACLGTVAVCVARIFLNQGRVGRESKEELAIANRFITGALGAMTAVRDVETGQHVVRIQGYLRSLCQVVAGSPRFKNYLTPEMIELLVQLAPIHDIGKVGVPDNILRKPGPLTSEEFSDMKSHVTLGKRILEEAREQSGLKDEVFFETAKDIVYSHHERWDGSGYPLGLSGDAIPIPGRLLAVADVYDALISKRHYKPEFLHAEAVGRICMGAGHQFDPELVDGFLLVHDDWRRMAEAHRDEPGIAATAR